MHETDNRVIVDDVLCLYEIIAFNAHLEQILLYFFCILKILSQHHVFNIMV